MAYAGQSVINILYCTVLYCIALYCTVLYGYSSVPYHSAQAQQFRVLWSESASLSKKVEETSLRAVPEIILGGEGGHKHFFVLWVEGVLLTMCLWGGGWGGNLSWGSRCI